MKKPLTAATAHKTVNTIMGASPSISANSGAKLVMSLDTRLQTPIAVTANKVGNIWALATYTILNMHDMPNFVPNTIIGNYQSARPSEVPKMSRIIPPIMEKEKRPIVATRMPR